MNPLATIRRATRAALRRRYAYAAMRVLRRGFRAALATHRARQLDRATYATSTDAVRTAIYNAIARLRRRWPNLNPDDPRSQP